MATSTSSAFSIRVLPAAVPDVPSWVAALPLFEWHRLATPVRFKWGTKPTWAEDWFAAPYHVDFDPAAAPHVFGGGGEGALFRGEVGMAVRRQGSWIFTQGGGHGETDANLVLKMQLNAETPRWEVATACSDGPTAMAGHTPSWKYCKDGRPIAGHTSYSMWYNPDTDRFNMFGQRATNVGWGGNGHICVWDFATQDWIQPDKPDPSDPATWTPKFGTELQSQLGYHDLPICGNDANGDVFLVRGGGTGFERWQTASVTEPYTRTYLPAPADVDNMWTHQGLVCAAERNLVYAVRNRWPAGIGGGVQETKLQVYDIETETWDESRPWREMPSPPGVADNPTSPGTYQGGYLYEPNLQKILCMWADGSSHAIDPDTGDITVPFTSVDGLQPQTTRFASGIAGIANKWAYLPELKGCVYLSAAVTVDGSNGDYPGVVWFVRTAM